MAVKTVLLPSVGEVKLVKRRGTKHLRIRLSSRGEVAVSLPVWLPFAAGIKFAEEHREWITKHRKEPQKLLPNTAVGKRHLLSFGLSNNQRTSVKVIDNKIMVRVPTGDRIDSTNVQAAAIRGARKALQLEADHLEKRLAEISSLTDLKYTEVNFKFMRSRWGSCRSDQKITLNYRLLDLSDELIDYVLVHELAHTRHLNHSPKFWELVESIVPDHKQKRKELKKIQLSW